MTGFDGLTVDDQSGMTAYYDNKEKRRAAKSKWLKQKTERRKEKARETVMIKMEKLRLERSAALIQAGFRGRTGRLEFGKVRDTKNNAARIIQGRYLSHLKSRESTDYPFIRRTVKPGTVLLKQAVAVQGIAFSIWIEQGQFNDELKLYAHDAEREEEVELLWRSDRLGSAIGKAQKVTEAEELIRRLALAQDGHLTLLPEDGEAAATKLQASYRGLLGRRRAHRRADVQTRRREEERQQLQAFKLQESRSQGMSRRGRRGEEAGSSSSSAAAAAAAASRIQAVWRGKLGRWEAMLLRAQQAEEVERVERQAGQWPAVLDQTPEGGWPEVGVRNGGEYEPGSVARQAMEAAKLRVLVVTWNLQGKAPADIHPILPQNRFHVYVVGTEECERSIAASAIRTSKRKWEAAVGAALGEEYSKLCAHSLTAMQQMVFVHRELLPWVTAVQSASVATGVGNRIGNKGGVGVSLSIGRTSFLFINAHFAAHQSGVRKRNEDFRKIASGLSLKGTSQRKSDGGGGGGGGGGRAAVVDGFDRVVWSGDLNYRVNGNRRIVDALLASNMHEVLLNNDQLSQERRAGRVFQGFEEGPLHFRPTYKFDKGSDVYDSGPKARIPSWTDRILHKGEGIELLSYTSCTELRFSDHRAVSAVYDMRFDGGEDAKLSVEPHQGGSKDRSQVCLLQ